MPSRSAIKNQEKYYLYNPLFLVQGQGGQEVQESDHWIDKKYLEYWKECIDETFRPVDLKTEVIMIPENIRQNMK